MTHAYDPELAPWAPIFAQLSFADIPAARAGEPDLLAALPPYDPPVPLDVDELLVPGPEGAPEVRVRRYRPADHDGRTCRRWSTSTAAASWSAASTSTTPTAAGSRPRSVPSWCRSTTAWPRSTRSRPRSRTATPPWSGWRSNAAELGVDPDRIAVGGESAGGGLAAGVALLARDRGGPRLCLQFLGIPELDDRLDTESMRSLGADCPITTLANGEISWDSYLGQGVRGTDQVSPYAAPRAPPTSPGCRPRWSRPTSSTRSATRTSPTPSGCCRPECRPSCTSTPGPSTPAPGSPPPRSASRSWATSSTACAAGCTPRCPRRSKVA